MTSRPPGPFVQTAPQSYAADSSQEITNVECASAGIAAEQVNRHCARLSTSQLEAGSP